MSELAPLIEDLAFILVLAGIVTIFCKKFNQPLVLGYILAGFFASPHFNLLPNVVDTANITVWSDIGVIFILFNLGLDFNFAKIKSIGGTALIAAVTELTGITLLGYACARLLGWQPIDSFFAGAMLTMSSTAVVSKTFEELGLLKERFTQFTFGILVLEDISGIIMMVMLSTIAAAGAAISGTEMLGSIGELAFFLIICFVCGIFFLPTFFRKVSRYLTSDMAETASCVIHLAAKLPPFDGCSNFFPLVEAMISDKDVSDHHAIIPTMEIEKADIKALPLGERNLFLLVCCKLLCASAELYVYEAVTATFDCGGYSFTAKGKRILSEGWREIDRIFRAFLKEKPADGDGDTLPDFAEGQTFDGAEVAVTEHFTQPPKPYTEDTLLSAMENAGKDDIPDEAERKGLGTPATRAAIIEKLVAAGFVERKGKSLIPTKAGINLVTVLPEPLTSPMLTAEWEQKLTEIAKGGADPDTFMDGIRTMVQEIVSTYSCISEDGKKLFAPEKEVIGTCPRCGQPVYEGKKNFACSDRSCGFVLWKNDRFWTSRKKELTKKMATDLLKKGRTNVKGMWSEKKQAAYDAAVILNDTGGKYINFKLEFPKRKEGVNGRK